MPASRLAPHLELFNRIRLLGAVGTNLDVLSQVETLETYPRLQTDLSAFSAAGWAIELLDGLSADGESVPDAYHALLTFLRSLELSDEPPEVWLGALTLTLLNIHGYSPELATCTSCGTSVHPGRHAFAPLAGGVTCSDCAHQQNTHTLSLNTLKVLRFLSHEGFHGAAKIRVDAATRSELRNILRVCGSGIVERDIKSARMLDRVAVSVHTTTSGER